jgi:hypothetical protein
MSEGRFFSQNTPWYGSLSRFAGRFDDVLPVESALASRFSRTPPAGRSANQSASGSSSSNFNNTIAGKSQPWYRTKLRARWKWNFSLRHALHTLSNSAPDPAFVVIGGNRIYRN